MDKKPQLWVVIILTFLLPGLGHYYCNKKIKGIMIFIGAVIIIYLSWWIFLFADIRQIGHILPVIMIPAYFTFILIITIRTAMQSTIKISNDKFAKIGRPFLFLIYIIIVGYLSFYSIYAWGEFRSFKIPSKGMEPTLMAGDILLADMQAYESSTPHVNDLVIFLWPNDTQIIYIKRCIALEGQEIEIIDKQLYIDGVAVDELHQIKHDKPIMLRDSTGKATRDNWGPHIVPDGSYFMLGDNRDNSYDSRFWGFVREDLVIGRAMKIIWSDDFDRFGLRIE